MSSEPAHFQAEPLSLTTTALLLLPLAFTPTSPSPETTSPPLLITRLLPGPATPTHMPLTASHTDPGPRITATLLLLHMSRPLPTAPTLLVSAPPFSTSNTSA